MQEPQYDYCCRMPYSRPEAAYASLTHSQTPASGRGFVRLRRKIRVPNAVFSSLLLLAVILSTSCRKAVEKAQRNIRFEGIEKIERQGLTGAEMVVRVMNDTGYKLQLNMAEIDIYYSESRVGTIVLREPVEVPRRTTDSFRTLWRLKISDPMALYVLLRKVEAGDLSQVGVAYALEGRGGPAPVKISRDRMPLSDFLNTFGLTLQDVKNQLK